MNRYKRKLLELQAGIESKSEKRTKPHLRPEQVGLKELARRLERDLDRLHWDKWDYLPGEYPIEKKSNRVTVQNCDTLHAHWVMQRAARRS